MHTSSTPGTGAPTPPPLPLVHPAFEMLRQQHIPTLNVVLEEYRHKVTGAQYFHLASDDTENVFLVALRTVPMDSTGVAHILEHTVLCGSERYPVRDPFFMMIRRSLNTFMNAFTSSDWTAYPFASKNRKDFNNLLEVYLDAVFFSRLHELDFAQEGHRLEFAEAGNPDSPLQYKGVVFNEMKGAMSSTNSVLWQTISKYLYPTTTYHYNSGGEPDHIPDLSYADLKEFYTSHYHPSNAVFMTYGDIPAYEHQQRFHDLALARFERLDSHIHVRDEKRYFAPVRVEESYPLREEEEEDGSQNKTHVVLAWLLGKSIDLDDMFQAQLLSSVLLDNSASPLMQVLETCGLGTAPSPMCGLEDSNREMGFMCGLEGCARDAAPEVEALIRSTLEKVAEDGVPEEQVHAALHQLELHQREITGDSHPYGLQLIMAGLSSAVHGGDPLQVLDIDPALARLRQQIEDPAFIGKLIHRLLLDNPHQVVLTLQPDTHLAARQVEAEMQRLQRIKALLSPEETQHILAQTTRLAERQEAQDDPSLLPKVGLEDVPAELSDVKRVTTRLQHANTPVSFYPQGTNGLCYEQIVIDLPALDDELLAVLPYYTACLPEFGVGKRSYAEVQTWQSGISGGVNCYANVRSLMEDEQQNRAIMVLSSKALVANHQGLDELLQQTFTQVRFDEIQRLREIMDQISARRESSITGQGHVLAMALASSGMSPTAKLSHRFTGLQGITTLRALSKQLKKDENARALLDKFKALHERIQAAPRQFLLVGEDASQDSLIHSLDQHWQQAHTADAANALNLAPCREQVRQIWATNTQVNFCAKAYPTVAGAHPDHATLSVLARFLSNGFLHRVIREQGGAYGGGADQDANSAAFRFYSYRDPRLAETLQDYDRAIEWVLGADHEERLVEEAILGVISSMDKSSSPAGEAKQAFYNDLFGRTLERRQRYREQVLATTLQGLQRVAERYLVDPSAASVGIISYSGQMAQAEALGLEAHRI
ncbi:MAG: insulinase family protein [Pseudomonadales bacterium]|nr:insulinase family protein [Pseudomonadales bacterium]